MWRSFFFAFGTMLIILGAQCIIVGEFTISTDSNVVKIGKRIINSGQSALSGNEIAFETESTRTFAEASSQRGFGGQLNGISRGGDSAFGDSRMEGNRFGNEQFFNALPTSSNSNSPFQLPGRMNSANSSQVPAQAVSQKFGFTSRSKVFRTEDWMPWSLIAAGAIVVLYTKSWQSPRGME